MYKYAIGRASVTDDQSSRNGYQPLSANISDHHSIKLELITLQKAISKHRTFTSAIAN